jgi:SAM-dependent methyltransferase
LPEQPQTPGAQHEGADDWDLHWTRYAGAVELNPAQDFRRRLILDALEIHRPNARIIDIGAGTGDLAAKLLEDVPSPQVLGLELSETGVELARRKVPSAEFLRRDLLIDAEISEQHRHWAEYAVCSEVLEHVDDPITALVHAREYLAPGCRLVVTVPGGPMSAFDRHIGHRRHFRPADAGRVLEAAGYEVESLRGVGFPFFNLYRFAVIAAGQRLIQSERDEGSPPGRMIRVMGAVFHALLDRNRGGTRFGFQTVAVAHNPDT